MLKLRPYQQEDVNKLSKLKRSALLNEQRTGKTPTALKIIEAQKHKKILIVCPGTALYIWKEEFEKWLNKPCVVLEGKFTAKKRQDILENWTDGLIISFDTLKLIPRTKVLENGKEKIYKTGMLLDIIKQKPDAIIVDEFHRAKNKKTLTARSLMKLRDVVEYRMALTGTPAYAKTEDIWTLLNFLYPALFPTYWKFLEEYYTYPLKWTPNGMARDLSKATLVPAKELKLQRFLNKIAAQRKQADADVMPWLPKKPVPKLIRLPLTDSQEKYLEELTTYFEVEGLMTKTELDKRIRYRQICQDPRLVGLKGKGAKTEWFEHYIKEYPDTPTIFFSNFTGYLKLLNEIASTKARVGLITGEQDVKDRFETAKKFQNGELDYLLINIIAGKESLTLDRAERMIFLDDYPPSGNRLQAAERFTATKESRKDIPKEIWNLAMRDTYDEEIYTLVEQKASETEVFNNFKKYLH